MTRSESKRALLEELGAIPVVADALDGDQVAEAVGQGATGRDRPPVDRYSRRSTRAMPTSFELTNRLRTEGTDHLLTAGQAVGVRRFVAQSNISAYARTGAAVKSEEDPVDGSPASGMARERRGDPPPRGGGARRDLDGGNRAALRVVLRPGHVDGPGPGVLRAGPQAQVPAGRRRWRRVVVHPHRRRRGGDGGGGRARPQRDLQRRRRRPGRGRRVAAGAGRAARRQEADARAALRRAAVRGRVRRGADDRDPRRLQRQGQARAGVAPGHPSWRQGFAAA